jgi:Fe-S-cluster-containing dehydrogenase component
MVHEGMAQLSISRIQILEDRFACYPNDILIATCKQCKDPSCLTACPVHAIYVDENHMNVRRVDESKCIGCKSCIKACHFSPSRVRFHPVRRVTLKCDLCKDTPYWKHEKGKLACVEVCPVNALMLTFETPIGYHGYEVNLRGEGWKKLDLPVD